MALEACVEEVLLAGRPDEGYFVGLLFVLVFDVGVGLVFGGGLGGGLVD